MIIKSKLLPRYFVAVPDLSIERTYLANCLCKSTCIKSCVIRMKQNKYNYKFYVGNMTKSLSHLPPYRLVLN